MNALLAKKDSAAGNRFYPKRSHDGDLFREQQDRLTKSTDRTFALVLAAEWVAALALAIWVAPLAWKGGTAEVHQHVWAAGLLGALIAAVPIAGVVLRPGAALTRHVVAIVQMLMTALFIHLTGGRIETHFMVFGSLAFLAFYRDWTVLVTATAVVLVDHLARGIYFPQSIYGAAEVPWWRTLEHAWWVLFEDIFLFYAIRHGNEIQQLAAAEKMRELGQYIVKERLGEGGMGEVYLAEHRLLKRPCAIKLIKQDLATDDLTLTRFEREVQSTARLTHPNTVAIYDYGSLEDGTFYYVMEYLHGMNLQQMVERHGALPPARVVFLLRQVCRALVEAHNNGLIHRDIKPDNVFVCEQGNQHDVPKLLDFGLVHTVLDDPGSVRLTQVGEIMGTPYYMSPEQVTGEELDARSDLYSLGTLAYFLLTARPPFEGRNAQATMYARVQRSVDPPSALREQVPEDLEQVVLRCMARRPVDRYSDARSLERALAGCACRDEWDDDRAEAWWKEIAASAPGDGSAASQQTPMLKPSSETGQFAAGGGTLQIKPE